MQTLSVLNLFSKINLIYGYKSLQGNVSSKKKMYISSGKNVLHVWHCQLLVELSLAMATSLNMCANGKWKHENIFLLLMVVSYLVAC